MGSLSQRADLDVLPAALGAGGPVLAAVDLDGDASFGPERFEDGFLVVAFSVGCRAVPDADLLVVDPGGDFRVFAFHEDAGSVPIVDFPGLDPFLGGAGGNQADFLGRLVLVGG